MTVMRNVSVICVVGAVALGLSACDKLGGLNKAKTEPAGSAATATIKSAEEDKDEQLGNKLAEYIRCTNTATRSVHNSRNHYLRSVNEETGPTGKEPYISGPLIVSPGNCESAIKKAKTLPPSMPEIEKAAAAYQKALEELIPVVKRAHDYYDQKDYKDDELAAGKQMHKPLVDAFKKFETANEAFSGKVTKLNDALAERRLVRLEKADGPKLAYHTEKALHEAKKLVKLAEVETLEKLDLAKFTPALESFEKAVQALETYADSHKEEVSKVMMFSRFPSEAKNFLKSAKELMRRKRDSKDFNTESLAQSNPKLVDGHPAQVIDTYNNLIQASNSLRF